MNNTMDLSAAKHIDQAERLSAFLDGELSLAELDALLDAMDDGQCAELKRYHLISDVMRDGSLAIRTSDLFSMRLSRALAAEPAHVPEDTVEWQEPLVATGTDGAYKSAPSSAARPAASARIHPIPSRSKTRLAFVAGGVAAAFATIMTYNIFQSSDIQSAADIGTPVLVANTPTASAAGEPATAAARASVSTAPAAPTAPATSSSAIIAAAESAPTSPVEIVEYSPVRSFSYAPTVVVSAPAAAASARAGGEERRRTYPEYLRSHSDMSAQTPFMQVNYQGTGFAQ